MQPYRILVVDDSAFMRKLVSDIIAEDDGFTVVATAKNGREAIELVTTLKPDAVTLDVEMPEMNGLEALPLILAEWRKPVIMLSSSTQEGTMATIRALELGAFDFVPKPSGPMSMDINRVHDHLLATLRAAVTSTHRPEAIVPPPKPSAPAPEPKPLPPPMPSAPPNEIRPLVKPKPPAAPKPVAKSKPAEQAGFGKAVSKPEPPRRGGAEPPSLKPTAPEPAPKPKLPSARSVRPLGTLRKLVAIGTSTGGPRALQAVLTQLPADFPAPILIVQHMPAGFTKSLAQRLDTLCSIHIVEAEDGMEPVAGTAYIAPGGFHLVMQKVKDKYRLRLTKDPQRNGHRPSVDVLFESLNPFHELDRTAVIMTGMGSDGAKGMKLLKDGGVKRTIAEDQSSCVVYGMPRAAVELDCVNRVVPLEGIARQIIREVTLAEEV